MKNSEPTDKSQEILDHIFTLLSESQISHEIDYPIDQALAQFSSNENIRTDNPDLLVYTGTFIHHLYSSGIRPLHQFSEKEAVVEALYLLEQMYQGTEGSGYIAALVEFKRYGQEERMMVLKRLCEAIKQKMREKYMRWVYTRHFYLKVPKLQEQLVERLLQQFKPYISSELLHCRPFQLIDLFPMIVQTCMSVDANIRKIMTT